MESFLENIVFNGYDKFVSFPGEIYTKLHIQQMMVITFVCGCLVSLGLYNLILSIKIKEQQRLYLFIFYILVSLLEIGCFGLAYEYSQTSGEFLTQHFIEIFNLSMITYIIFSKYYFEYNCNFVLEKKVFYIILSGPVIVFVIKLLAFNRIAFLLSILILVIGFGALLTLAFKYKESNPKVVWFFLIATCFIVLCYFMHLFIMLKVLEFNLSTFNGLLACVFVCCIFLTYTLTDQLYKLKSKNLELVKSEESLMILSMTDGLTKLYNRRYFDDRLKIEIEKAENSGEALSLLMIDIDFFKNFNDEYGHHEGDKILRKLGIILQKSIGNHHYACRYGGEEFAIIAPGLDRYRAERQIAHKIHSILSKSIILITKKQKKYLTVSIGIADIKKGDTNETLIQRADSSLYIAKKSGRNRTVVHENILKK